MNNEKTGVTKRNWNQKIESVSTIYFVKEQKGFNARHCTAIAFVLNRVQP